MKLEKRAENIVNALLLPANRLVPDDANFVLGQLRTAINDKLEEVAIELDKLSQGHYTSAQTPAGLVRAMKVK